MNSSIQSLENLLSFCDTARVCKGLGVEAGVYESIGRERERETLDGECAQRTNIGSRFHAIHLQEKKNDVNRFTDQSQIFLTFCPI